MSLWIRVFQLTAPLILSPTHESQRFLGRNQSGREVAREKSPANSRKSHFLRMLLLILHLQLGFLFCWDRGVSCRFSWDDWDDGVKKPWNVNFTPSKNQDSPWRLLFQGEKYALEKDTSFTAGQIKKSNWAPWPDPTLVERIRVPLNLPTLSLFIVG